MQEIWNVILNIGAFLGFVGAGYAVYELLQRAKVELYPANIVSFPVSRKGYISKFHLGCNLANKTSKLGAVQRLEVEVTNPKNKLYKFQWKLFYEYQPDTGKFLKESDPYPIVIMPKNSQLLFIEFEATNSIESLEWIPGRYEFKVIGWVNKKDRNSKSNLEARFHINITETFLKQLLSEQKMGPPKDGHLTLYGPSLCAIPVEEWCF